MGLAPCTLRNYWRTCETQQSWERELLPVSALVHVAVLDSSQSQSIVVLSCSLVRHVNRPKAIVVGEAGYHQHLCEQNG
jgi:hypothetical protein